MLLDQAPGDQFFRLIVAVFHEQPLGDAVLEFVGVGERGIGVEANNLREIVDAGDVVVVKERLDRVLVFFR